MYIRARTAARREPIITHIYPLLSDPDYCGLLTKLIGITSENPDGAKRTRTADPLHAMQVLYQLSYGPKTIFFLVATVDLSKTHLSKCQRCHMMIIAVMPSFAQ